MESQLLSHQGSPQVFLLKRSLWVQCEECFGERLIADIASPLRSSYNDPGLEVMVAWCRVGAVQVGRSG